MIMSNDKPAHTASGESDSPLRRAKSVPDGKQGSKFGTFLHRSWFQVIIFAESYKLRSLAAIFCWMLLVWIIGTNLVWVFEQSLPPDVGSRKASRR